MTKILRMLACLTLLCGLAAVPVLAAQGDAPASGQMGGFVVTYQGNKLEVVRFKNLLPEYIFRYQGIIQTIPMTQIKSLTMKSGSVLLEKRDGQTLRVTGNLVISSGTTVEFVLKSSVGGGEMDGHIDPILITQIIFN